MKATTWILGAALALGPALALRAAQPPQAERVLRQALGDEPCGRAFLAAKPGLSYEYRFFEAEDLQDHWFVMLRRGDRYLLLELRVESKAAATVLERRAWIWRNHQRRTLTEADGLAVCDTRLGVPLERLEKVWDRAQAPGRWTRGRWPEAPKPAPVKKKKSEKPK